MQNTIINKEIGIKLAIIFIMIAIYIATNKKKLKEEIMQTYKEQK